MTEKENHPSAERLLAAAQEATKGRVDSYLHLYKDMNESPQTMKNWRERATGVSSAGAQKAERLYGASVSWILHGEHPPARGKSITQHAIPSGLTVETQLLEWGTAVGDLPEFFRLAMPDNAMAPDAEMGWEVEFARGKNARPGEGVLVEDSSGERYFRMYRKGRGDNWEAHATSQGYLPLESDRDGLEILAVMKFVRKPRLG